MSYYEINAVSVDLYIYADIINGLVFNVILNHNAHIFFQRQ